jgi:hypothetical protein
MGVITTKEQIRNDQGPSFMLPFRPNPFATAGRTLKKRKKKRNNGDKNHEKEKKELFLQR